MLRRLWQRRSVRIFGAALLFMLLVYALLPDAGLYTPEFRYSRTLEDRRGQLMHLALTADGKYRRHVPLAQISPDLISATLELEDRHFYEHPGVNPMSLLRAAWGVVTGSARGGGSTITMQLARLRHGLHTRNAWGKLVQVFRAVQMERHHGKEEILEAYLNQAPYGGNVEGIGAASLLWCGKEAHDLTLREAVTLSVLPQSPTRRRPRAAGDNASLAAAQHRLWDRLRQTRGLPADPLDESFTLRQLLPVPRDAPHLARRLFGTQDPGRVASGLAVHSTVALETQHRVESVLADYLGRKKDVGITNACALLVHASTREVRAYVGSSAFLNREIQGQVDGVLARRSPGSALKPFIYALAMQQGLIHPYTLLRDGQTSFGGYNPENFDRQFSGPIAARDALYHSRNIPAVSLTQRLASPGLYGFLKSAGVALPRPSEHYGLALPLGGAEVSMEELASLYCLLADDGCARPVWFTPGGSETMTAGKPLLTPEARYLTREMIRTREGEPALDDPGVLWKTGTSHGFRDAWAAGIRGDYVLVVWIGNFNGRANPAFIARECAAPLLFEIFRHMPPPSKRVMPGGLAEVELCAVSGQLPTPLCQHRVRGGFIPGVSPITACEIHREMIVDSTTGLRVARDDGRPGLQRSIQEFWPPDMLEMFRKAGVPRKSPPPLEAGTDSMISAESGQSPKITSPQSALVYTLRASAKDRQTIPLRADAAPGVSRVFWFADSRFLGSCAPTEPVMWQASAGHWRVHVLDDQGRSAAVRVRVEMLP